MIGCANNRNKIGLIPEDIYLAESDLELTSNWIITRDSFEVHIDTVQGLLARKYPDSITIQFSASFFNGYRLDLKIIGDRYQINLEKSNCMTTNQYNIVNSEVKLLQREYQEQDSIKGVISFKADYIEEDLSDKNIKELDVELHGKFSILLRDSSFTYRDLSREIRNDRFNSLLKTPEKIESRLDMSGLGLTKIPIEKIRSLKKIDTIDLSQNELTKIDIDKLKEFDCLKYLDLSSNIIESIPQRIDELNCLEELNLFNNQISSIPKELYKLERLRKLELERNQLTIIPVGISVLLTEYLGLGENPIKRLPNELQRMKNLNELRIPKPKDMEYIPKGVLKLCKMQFKYQYKPDFTNLSNYKELQTEIEEVLRK